MLSSMECEHFIGSEHEEKTVPFLHVAQYKETWLISNKALTIQGKWQRKIQCVVNFQDVVKWIKFPQKNAH